MGDKLVRADLQAIEKALKKVQMELIGTKDIVARFVYDGKQVVTTKFSCGRGDIPTWVVGRIKGQLKLNTKSFNDLISCPLKRDGLIRIYRDLGLIEGASED